MTFCHSCIYIKHGVNGLEAPRTTGVRPHTSRSRRQLWLVGNGWLAAIVRSLCTVLTLPPPVCVKPGGLDTWNMGLISTIDNIFVTLRFLPCFSVSIINLMLLPAFISPYHPRLTHSSTKGLSWSPPISHADNRNPDCSCFRTLSALSLPHCHGYPIISTISTQPQAWLSLRWSWLLHPIGTGFLEPERFLYCILPANWKWQGLNLPSLICKGNV